MRNKIREQTLADWEVYVPELVEHCTRDLKFLAILYRIEKTLHEDEEETIKLLRYAWHFDQQGLDIELDKDRFMQDIKSGLEFIHSMDFNEYVERFSRYI